MRIHISLILMTALVIGLTATSWARTSSHEPTQADELTSEEQQNFTKEQQAELLINEENITDTFE